MPSRAGEQPAAQRPGHEHGMEADGSPAGQGAEPGSEEARGPGQGAGTGRRQVQARVRDPRFELHDELLHVSQVEHHNSGAGYWRSLEQLAETSEVVELLAQEFPGYDPSSMVTAGPSRRRFLRLMGASLA